MKALSKSDKLKALIVTKMTDIITLLDRNGKYDVYIRGEINRIYRYLEMIGAPTTLKTMGQLYHHFGPSSSIKNET